MKGKRPNSLPAIRPDHLTLRATSVALLALVAMIAAAPSLLLA